MLKVEHPTLIPISGPAAPTDSDAHVATTRTTTRARVPRGVPTRGEFEAVWKLWDHITLGMIPESMLHTKPIDLRHICLFYLGHIPTFLDIYLSRITDGTYTNPQYFKDIFERGIDPDVEDPTKIHSHSEVPTHEEDWPGLQAIVTYRDGVRARLGRIYDAVDAGAPLTARAARSLFMGLEHEAMHAETLLYMLIQSPMTRPPHRTPQWDILVERWKDESALAMAQGHGGVLDVAACTVTLGHNDNEHNDGESLCDPEHEFGWDCEHPVKAVAVSAFKVDVLAITNNDYMSFLVATGKIAGLEAPTAPASWIKHNDVWCVRSLFGPIPFSVAGNWPIVASKNELDAYAAYKGGRLPTEAELRALWEHPLGPRPDGLAANIGFKNWHPVPPMPTIVDTAGVTLHGHNGGVWEWTTTEFAPFEGYVQSELYPGYSSDFFDGKHFVVLGGGYATVPRLVNRRSFRNWFQATYRYAWAGGRVAYDL